MLLAAIPPITPAEAKIRIKTIMIIIKQKYDLAKLRKLTFFVPPKANTKSIIKPIHGIENNISYPKYPHIDIGLYSSGILPPYIFIHINTSLCFHFITKLLK